MPRSKRRNRAALLLSSGITVAAMFSASSAQTNGTWGVDVGTAGGSWSNPANWVGGVIPGNGGSATFTTLPFTTAPLGIIQDASTVTLSSITFDSFITYLLKPPTGVTTNSITLTGAATINTPLPSINTLSTTVFGQQASISFGGTSGLNKVGPGTLTLWQTNTYTGGTTINGGVVVARQWGDACFGNSAGSITLNDGTIRVTTGAWTSARQINLAGNGTIEASAGNNVTWNGAITGSGNLNKIGSNALLLSASSNHTGATNLLAGTMSISGASGALTSTSSVSLRNTLTLDNANTNLNDRLPAGVPVTFYGSGMTVLGNTSVNSSQSIGSAVFSRGTTLITLTPGSSTTNAVLAAGSAARDDGGVLFVRGTNLGAMPDIGIAKMTFTTPPALIGGGGGAGSKMISLIPWAYGNLSSAGSLNSSDSSFLTYDSNGLRPLLTTGSNTVVEYDSTISGLQGTHNVRLTAPFDLGGQPASINALVVAPGATTVSGQGTLSIVSGGLLNLTTSTISCPVDFGSAEGIVIAAASTNLSGSISGTGGLTKQGVGVATFANAANNYTGTTIIGGGTVNFLASIPSGAPSAFGSSTSAIVLAPAGVGTGGATARLIYAGAAGTTGTFDRDLLVSGRIALNNAATLPGFGVVGGTAVVMNGNITLDNSPLSLQGGAGGATITINGNITGSGGPLNDQGDVKTIVLNGNNTFSGGVELGTVSGSIWQVGSDSAFGTGMIKTVQTSSAPTIMSVGGAHIVPNDAVSFSFSSTYWTIGGANDITFTGSINLSGSYTHNITNTGVTTYAGVLHTGGFTKAGLGTLVLSGSNIYTGTSTITGGVLRATNSQALGSASIGTVINTGAALELTNNSLTSEPVTLIDGGIANTGAIRSTSGVNNLGDVTISGKPYIGVDAGTLRVGNVGVAAGVIGLDKVGGGELAAARYRVATLTINAGTASVLAGRDASKTSRITALSIAPTAALDLNNNDLIVDYPAASPLATIQSLIGTGYNDGSWTGNGITSSAAASTAASAHATALGFAEASALGTFPLTFSGQTINANAVLVRYTYSGDSNINGTVDLTDFTFLAANFNKPSGATWLEGDYNYDGKIDLTDFTLLASNFNQTLPVGVSMGATVPEPAAMSLIAAGFGYLNIRRRRR